MTTHFNYSLQNFSMNNARVLTGNSQPVPDFKCSFVSCYNLKVSQACPRPPFTSEVKSFEPNNIQTHSAPQNDRLNLLFVKDKYTVGRKIANNGCRMANCYCHLFLLRLQSVLYLPYFLIQFPPLNSFLSLNRG